LRSNFRRSGESSELFDFVYTLHIRRSYRFRFCILGVKIGTKKCPIFYLLKVTESLVKNLPPSKLFFFWRKSKKKLKTTLIQIPMAHLKITFWQKKFDRVSQLQASKGSKRHLLDHICARTFQGLHSVRLWTPTILYFLVSNILKKKSFQKE
jgi:hypothetical protein